MARRLTERTGQSFHLITRKEDLTPERLREIAPRTIFFPHWSYLIPPAIHEGWECIIFHMTDLPYGRGGSPLQNLIQRGHRETMLTALRCVAELDAGPIYLKRPRPQQRLNNPMHIANRRWCQGLPVRVGR